MVFDLNYQRIIQMEAFLVMVMGLWVARHHVAKHLSSISGKPIDLLSEQDDDEDW